jgi:hypothetical protein
MIFWRGADLRETQLSSGFSLQYTGTSLKEGKEGNTGSLTSKMSFFNS